MATAFPNNPIFGETTDLAVAVTERDGATFTITAATVTITKTDGTKLRNGVACTIDNTLFRASYLETFSTANGYAEGTTYYASFKVTMSSGHVEKHECEFRLLVASDE